MVTVSPAANEPLSPPPQSLLHATKDGQVLWETPNTATTVKISLPDGKPAVVRYGKLVRISEALTVQYVQQHSPLIPVAPVIAIYSSTNPENPGETINYIVSEWIEGEALEDLWENLPSSEQEHLFDRIRDIVKAIRSIPVEPSDAAAGHPSPYIGSVGYNPCGDPLLAGLGPFRDMAGLNEALLGLAKPHFRHAYSSIVQRVLERNQHYQIVFTHGDIAPRNIIVRRTQAGHPSSTTGPDAADVGEWEVAALIDWECAGFYPEHWEYVKALNAVKWKSDWAQRVQFLLDQHYDEDFLLDSRLRFYYRM